MVAADPVDVVDAADQHPDPFDAIGLGSAPQLFFDELLRCGVGEADAGVPRGDRAPPEPVFEEELEVEVVGAPLAVVQGLAVVGVGSGLEKQAGQFERVRVRRGVVRPLSPSPNAPVSAVNGYSDSQR